MVGSSSDRTGWSNATSPRVTSIDRSATLAISSSCGSRDSFWRSTSWARDTRQVSRTVQRHLHRTPLALHGRVERLANPPYRVADEIHADVRIVFVRRAHQSGVRLAHQITERHAAVLVLLGNGKCKAQVGANELGASLLAHVV